MWSVLADLFIGVFDFVLDVLMFRRVRRKRGHAGRGVAEDTMRVAHFDFVTMAVISLVSVGLMLLLSFGLGVPAGWSVGIGVVVGAIWGGWRYARLLRDH